MPNTLHFKSQLLIPIHSLLLNPISESIVTFSQCTNLASKAPIFLSYFPLSHHIQIPKPIICARKKRKASGSQRLSKILPNVVTFMASNLKILAEPLDLVIGEISGGDNGGGLGFLKGFGGGSFDGWRRKGKRNFGFLGAFVFRGLGLLLLLLFLFGRDLKSDLSCGVLGLGLLGAFCIKGCKKGAKDLVLGLCFLGVLVGLGLRREDMQKWVERLRVCSPALQLMKGKRRNGRRVF